MIGRLLSIITAALTPPEPEAPAPDPWAEFQGRVRAAREAARDDHAAIRHINARQSEVLHDALAGGKFKGA